MPRKSPADGAKSRAIRKKKEVTPKVYDNELTPLYYPYSVWINSMLSIARFYGAAQINGVQYEIDELTEDLCREDVIKERRKNYTPENLATIKAKYLSDEA